MDFRRAVLYPVIHFNVFGDPDANPFVVREGGAGVYGPASMWQRVAEEAEFHQRAATIDQGLEPYADSTGPNGLTNAVAFANRMRDLTINHAELQLAGQQIAPYLKKDTTDAFSFGLVIAKRDSRQCINANGKPKSSGSLV